MIQEILNRDKFAVSFHLLTEEHCKAYWYTHGGGTRFEVGDISTLWPRYFERQNGRLQSLSKATLKALREISRAPLIDRDYHSFYEQSHPQRVDHDRSKRSRMGSTESVVIGRLRAAAARIFE